MTRAAVYLPDRCWGPGRVSEVELEVVERGPAQLVLPEATVRDERGGVLFGHGGLADGSGVRPFCWGRPAGRCGG
jgi:hypothetical protein